MNRKLLFSIKTAVFLLTTMSWVGALKLHAQTYTASDFSATPAFLTDTTDPFVMIDLSVELTQQAEAYTDGAQTYFGGTVCPGRDSLTVDGSSWWNIGICYSFQEEYIGYFDPEKCYVYDTSGADATFTQTSGAISTSATPHHFRPIGFVRDAENNDYACTGSNDWSGHYLNWATMTALDEFRSVMTGGARILDQGPSDSSTPKTLLTRTHRLNSWPMAAKAISGGGLTVGGTTFTTNISDVLPDSFASNSRVFAGDNSFNNNQTQNRVDFYDEDGDFIDEYNVIVEVCNASVGLEENCQQYTDGTNTWYKPEGKIQQNAQQMRFALMTYSGESGNTRNGGVLRANAKYVGHYRPITGGGVELNPQAEINEFGQFVFHPDETELTDNGENVAPAYVSNSGVINYINQFALGAGRYKANDPFSELYYESLRYFMNAGRTDAYAAGLSADNYDDFPVITNVWDDPVLDSCQANYIIAVGDQFMHRDGDIPSANPNAYSDNATAVAAMTAVEAAELADLPSDWDVELWTNRIGDMERGDSDLGSSFMQRSGNNPDTSRGGRYNTFYVAGMAYYAKTQDIRSDLDGDQTIKTYVVDTQEYNGNPPTTYQNALWMAAKYGGFDEIDGSTLYAGTYPDPNDGTQGAQTDEWDADSDGVPDAYTLASQPQNLKKGLDNAFNDISTSLRASSAAGVVSNTASGEALVVQALYKSEENTDGGDRIEWLGLVQSLFIDEFNNIREDTHGVDHRLTTDDLVVVYNIDENAQVASVDLYSTTDNGETLSSTPVRTGVAIEELKTVWNVRDQLAEVSDFTTQRAFGSSANTGRYIFTSIDSDFDGIVDNDDVVAFDVNTFSNASDGLSSNFRFLGLDSGTGDNAENIVNFIRGVEGISGFRSRSIDYDGDGTDEPWLLGDVVTSSPVVVGRPSSEEDYDAIYGDESYEAFSQAYRDRRQVVYFGANDGMLHAVNAGFYDFDGGRYVTSLNSETAHPLGSEIWAYVPSNVLPHLQWLTELSYPHVYYVDGIPQSFDVNIFPPSATHPNGWGTILVVGLRFGGGEYTLDPDSDFDADLSDDYTSRSSYIILDITNPEVAPTLIGEITHPMLGYATGRPTVVKSRVEDEDTGLWSNEGWWLVFGSGPFGDDNVTRSDALSSGASNQTAKVFVFDLEGQDFVSFAGQEYIDLSSETDGFVGDFVAADWDNDFSDDAVYFGTVTDTVSVPGGGLFQMTFNASAGTYSISRVLSNVDKPFSGLPHVKQIAGENWLFTGTGRFYVPDDNLSSGQQSYYGILEPFTAGPVDYQNLADVTEIDVEFVANALNGRIFDRTSGATPSIAVNGTTYNPETFSELRRDIARGPGWMVDFDDLKAKHVGRTDSTGVSVGYTEYVSTGEACDTFGTSYLNLVHFGTGTAAPFAATDRTSVRSYGDEVAEKQKVVGVGLVRDVKYDSNRSVLQDGLGGLTVDEPNSPAVVSGRVGWREILINWE